MRLPRLTDAWVVALIEATTGPAIAVLFWMIVALVVLIGLKSPSAFDTNFFEAFGAVGQVVLAAAVFWLGKQQFEFSKQVAERQARIDTYSIKKELLERFLSIFEVTKASNRDTRDEDLHNAWYELADEISRVFDSDADVKIVFLAESLDELNGDTEFMRMLNEKHRGNIEGMQAALKENWKKVDNLHYEIWWKLHQETILGDRAISPIKKSPTDGSLPGRT